jgi:histone H3/H4
MSKKQYEPTPRAADIYRTQMALNSVLQSDSSAFRRDVRVDEGCSELLVDYSIGLAENLLGEAAKLAKHRGKDKIEPVDLNLALVKKLGMKMNSPDLALPRLVLHSEALGSGYGSMLHARPQNIMVTADEGLQHFKNSAAAKKGQKRKHE